VILESKSSSAVRPACCSLPVDFHPAASDQPSTSRDTPHHVWHPHQHYGDSRSEAAMVGSDIDDDVSGGPGPAVDVSPPAAGEFVDLNATRCSTALLLLHPDGGGPGRRFAGPPFCDSRRHPLQLANRTLVLIPAAPPASLTAHWFWNLLLPSSDTATSAATGGPDRPPAVLLLLVAVAMSLVLGCGRCHHWVVSCCFFVS